MAISFLIISKACTISAENIRIRTVLGSQESDFHGDRDFALFTEAEPASKIVVGEQNQ